ncbi:Exosome complex exonuclease rrp6 [Taphrina deformans PYCC 5710]|uniref:Exosome complex exonuclease rrp6 n=1 Tax=Taphrina deformans (strain PYCC 5710 / ATCC 11124 / CBS 356.35 / IMI 108563 / JCM 9778 / NBRC 8474) TaxID=1097556 RepID=R4XBH8_TAPDE|nr:Exosome complex exonuclease rrp6 [Taphrina deformans PYCC 5710]|eukprot:CCG80693.1 Exosome complex exonuclease rrp6 [Taphrina deformans PYCC 5710]
MAEEQITAAIRETVRAANVLGNNDLSFHRSLDTGFSKSLDSCLEKLLEITNELLSYTNDDKPLVLEHSTDVNHRWGDVIDVVDGLLESTDRSLEELTAKAKKEKEAAALKHLKQQERAPLPANLRNAQDLSPPQLKFARKPDNTDEPWKPLLTVKPHAKLGLEDSFQRVREIDGVSRIGHPYAYEIENLKYPDFLFEEHDPVMYKPVEDNEVSWVDTTTKLQAMLDTLKLSREIAVDLEHHDFHSFRGFVCLMQISNRDQDWIVDTLALRNDLQVLNEVFTNPSILKVFHGANSDIVWLQRDFGLYIVNLFDTYHASKTLGLEGHGLAFLLSKYVDFDADKRYQLADWRIRPLPKEMLYYARSDTHYLLYIYDLMRNELLQKSSVGTHNVMASVLQASADVALRQYVKEPYDAAEGQGSDGWQFLLQRFYGTRAFSAQQMEILKALHQWRDQKAREIDESTRFVLPNQAIISIAAAMPKDSHSLLTSCKQVSSTMQANLKPLLHVIDLAIKRANLIQDQARSEPRAAPRDDNTGDTTLASAQEYEFTQPHDLDVQIQLTSRSSFWGDLGRTLKTSHQSSPLKDLRLAVPIPAVTEEIYMTDAAIARAEAEAKAQSVAAETQKPVVDEVFVVKEVGRTQAAKRKSEVMDQDQTPVDAEAANSKREARKKAKQAKKEAKATVDPAEEKPAFDYAAQPSLLKEKEQKKSKIKKFGEFAGKIIRSKQVQGGKQTTFKR